jgi:hypothetical protein
MIRTIVAVMLSLFVSVALAEEPKRVASELRTIDFSTKIVDQDNQPIRECGRAKEDDPRQCAEMISLTLGRLAMTALNQNEAGLKGEDFVKRMKLGFKVFDAKELELGIDEIKLIKDQIEKLGLPQRQYGDVAPYKPLVIFRAEQLLDPVGTK